MSLSPDPMMDVLKSAMEGITLGKPDSDMSGINWIMNGEDLFGLKIRDAGNIETKIYKYFREMLAGPGAVRKTLHSLVNSEKQ